MKILQFYPFSKSPGEEARVGVLCLAASHLVTKCHLLGPSPKTGVYMRKETTDLVSV
jgi:hypothetical protein